MQTIMVFQRTQDIIGFAQENASLIPKRGKNTNSPLKMLL